ncbi:hypothetical protein D3C73_1353200 [compost metagenome]
MNRYGQPHLADQVQHSHILHNQRIGLYFIQEPQIFAGFLHIFFTEQIIDGDVDFFTQTMGKHQGLGNFFMRQIVAFAHHAHIQYRTAKIYRITGGLNYVLKDVKGSRRCQ